jgi:hypothetical protein
MGHSRKQDMSGSVNEKNAENLPYSSIKTIYFRSTCYLFYETKYENILWTHEKSFSFTMNVTNIRTLKTFECTYRFCSCNI